MGKAHAGGFCVLDSATAIKGKNERLATRRAPPSGSVALAPSQACHLVKR